jgi:hypothetical protein
MSPNTTTKAKISSEGVEFSKKVLILFDGVCEEFSKKIRRIAGADTFDPFTRGNFTS